MPTTMARYTRIFSLHPLVWLYLAVCFNASALTLNEPATKVPRDKLAEGLAVSYYLCEIFNHVDAFSDRSPTTAKKGLPFWSWTTAPATTTCSRVTSTTALAHTSAATFSSRKLGPKSWDLSVCLRIERRRGAALKRRVRARRPPRACRAVLGIDQRVRNRARLVSGHHLVRREARRVPPPALVAKAGCVDSLRHGDRFGAYAAPRSLSATRCAARPVPASREVHRTLEPHPQAQSA